MLSKITKSLNEWSTEHKLIERATECCKISLRNCALEEAQLFPTHNTGIDILRGRKLDDIELRFDKQSLVFQHDFRDYAYIDTQIGLYVADPANFYFRGLEPIGIYRHITGIDGGADDDYLDLDEELKEQE